ncbi:hypothetical protein ACTD5D_10050 [Nocardia takedensis]|uniref:hypothetical protein n=1 Tax=Nocardia takedensis TaxID=259390 RepID=UPI003F769043
MVSGLDAAAVRPGHRPDAGGLVEMLSGAIQRLDGVPFAAPPPVVMVARCFYGFGTITLASSLLDQQCVPCPEECLPVARECGAIGYELIEVIGGDLRDKYKLGAVAIAERSSDPMLEWIGPDLEGCVDKMLRLSARMRDVLENIAGDETASPPLRRAAENGTRVATFVHWQFFV